MRTLPRLHHPRADHARIGNTYPSGWISRARDNGGQFSCLS
jgi:hypothetical protein